VLQNILTNSVSGKLIKIWSNNTGQVH